MEKISVIVPVYNAGEYLHKCIDSILQQKVSDLELILVNDGSTDNSGEICDSYAVQDNRVNVIHKKNEGVSSARNKGIKSATGEYIGFVDSDDWIEPDMFSRLYSEADKNCADVVMCDANTVYSDGSILPDTITGLSANKVLNKSDFTPGLLLETAGAVWRCIYKRNLLLENNIRFPVDIKFSEDRIFNIRAFGCADKVVYLKESYYNRYVNKKSAVHRFHSDYFEACKKSAQATEKAIEEVWNNDETYQKAYLIQFITGAFTAINNYYYKTSTLTKKEKKDAVKKICNDEQLRSAIIHYGADKKSRRILNHNYTALIAYAKLANLKHGR